ncbi:uncharacterized protein LOC124657297 [Lolium rigidum]|uniref:uncharacterized protein LOC124657297 n=1 Tax=Lolium rigidum TaxID=89674 RepID=UPI001F5C9D15|nr:uncharacterized protein LOC124657297 [Lolium rigidum]
MPERWSQSYLALVVLVSQKAARRRQVPAFGEWNYYYHYDQPEAVAPPAAAYFYGATPEPEACSDVWFRYSPPPRKPAPAKKPRRRRVPEGDSDASLEKKGRRSARPASEANGGSLARATRVVRPVDKDLYQVPPPELASSHRRSPRRRSLWMGCLGCIA